MKAMRGGLTAAACSLFLVGCAGFGSLESTDRSPTDRSPNAGRYALSQDRGPAQPLSEQDVQEIEIIHEPRSRGGNSDYTLFGVRYEILDTAVGYSQEGYASWYGEKFHGHTTSNGETYDMFQLSAAHTTLPLPTIVRVTNLENGREVVARVNDRGPFHEDRIIDMSYAAAVRLGFADQGVARVRVEALTPDGVGDPQYFLQFGAFRESRAAQNAKNDIARHFSHDFTIENSGEFHRLRMGPLTEQEAISAQNEWTRKGNDKPLLVRQ